MTTPGQGAHPGPDFTPAANPASSGGSMPPRPGQWLPPSGQWPPASPPSGNGPMPGQPGPQSPQPQPWQPPRHVGTPSPYGPSGSAPDPVPYPPLPGGQPARPRNRAGVWIGAAVALAVLGGIVAYLVLTTRGEVTPPTSAPTAPQPAPTTAGTRQTEPAPQPGGEFTGTGFTATLPAGWATSDRSGDGNELDLSDGRDNRLTVYILRPKLTDDPADRCEREAKSLMVWEPGESSPAAAAEIDGKAAPGTIVKTDSGLVFELRCVAHAGEIYSVTSQASAADADAVAEAYAELLEGITWQE